MKWWVSLISTGKRDLHIAELHLQWSCKIDEMLSPKTHPSMAQITKLMQGNVTQSFAHGPGTKATFYVGRGWRVSQQFWQQIVAMVQSAQRSDHYIICEKKPWCLVIHWITAYYSYMLCFIFSVCMFKSGSVFTGWCRENKDYKTHTVVFRMLTCY